MKKILSYFFAFLLAATVSAHAAVVYNAIPSSLAPNYPSQPFQAQQTYEFGDYVHLGGTDRQLTTVAVTMSDWALAATPANQTFCTTSGSNCDSVGFDWPITVNIYANSLTSNVPNTLLGTKTVVTHIAWRPAEDPINCPTKDSPGYAYKYQSIPRAPDTNCSNGYAFNATFDLSNLNLTLPNDVIVGFVYNTQTYGPSPTGVDGPYNSLNIAVPPIPPALVPSVGSDDSNNEVFWNTSTDSYYTDGGDGPSVNAFRKDTNWAPWGTVAMQINAITPLQCNADDAQSYTSDASTMVDNHAAALLTFVHSAWTAANPGSWIWSTDPVADTTVDTTKTFTKDFTITGTPLDSAVQIAADNSYSVSVNGTPLLTAGCVDTSGATFANVQTCTIPAATLITGANQIEITVKNWATPSDTDYHNNPAGLKYTLTVHQNDCVIPEGPTNASVHIFKFLNGVQATPASANSIDFPMVTTFTSTTYGSATNIPFTLGAGGWGSDPAYKASFPNANLGANYSANEVVGGPLVGASCDGTRPYALAGYSVGDSMLQAQYGAITATVPSFTNLQGNKFIIVWNKSCTMTPPLKVHILKYLDGVKATATTAAGYQFPMTATWKTANLNGGVSTSGNYVLGNNHGGAVDQYGADTAPMAAPADYTTSEITDATSQVVSSAAMCVPGKYVLNGYRTSTVSFADAATKSLTALAPIFAGISADQYVIVDNSKCPTTGSISGMKYNDLNRNGKKDANEPGLKGWTIRLISEDLITDKETFVTSVVTDANGLYTFSNITPGTYEVRETHQNGWKRQSKNPKDIVIVAGSAVTDVNFGNAQKKKEEKEDSDKDDNRKDQDGHYYGNHGKSNYDKDQDNKEHSKKDDDKDGKNSH